MTPTARAIQAQLEAAYAKWDGAGAPKTKVRLAQLCAQMVKGKKDAKPCTPQTVNGWFKQGRIDKYWLPVVSAVLGTKIGVLVDIEEPELVDLRSALKYLAGLLGPMSGAQRREVTSILEDFTMKPEDHALIADQIERLLGGEMPRKAA